MSETPSFDAAKYKATTTEQWQTAAEAWHRWGPTLSDWLGHATDLMFDMAAVRQGSRVLDIAAGAGEQTLVAARRVGSSGHVLATDISANILEYAAGEARSAGLKNVDTKVMDGEDLSDLGDNTFDSAISRVGLIYFPDQQKALSEILRVLKPGGSFAAIVYAPADKNPFFSIPISIIRRRAQLPPPMPGQPGPFSLGAAGVLDEALSTAGFKDVRSETLAAPLRMSSAAECVRFERESFGALHQMMSSLSEVERQETWKEIERELTAFESDGGFSGPCEMVVGCGVKY